MVIVSAAPINPAEAYSHIAKKRSGSIVLHYAVVKDDTGTGTPTTCIDYRADGDVEAELAAIAAELQQRWTLEDVLLTQEGSAVSGWGEIISLVAASSPNSEDAFEACKNGISRMKTMSTICKTEKTSSTA